jgi:hypothetical protein
MMNAPRGRRGRALAARTHFLREAGRVLAPSRPLPERDCVGTRARHSRRRRRGRHRSAMSSQTKEFSDAPRRSCVSSGQPLTCVTRHPDISQVSRVGVLGRKTCAAHGRVRAYGMGTLRHTARIDGGRVADLRFRALGARFRLCGRNFCADARTQSERIRSVGERTHWTGPPADSLAGQPSAWAPSFFQIHFKSARAFPVSVGKRVRVLRRVSTVRALLAIAERPPSCSGGLICLEPAPP